VQKGGQRDEKNQSISGRNKVGMGKRLKGEGSKAKVKIAVAVEVDRARTPSLRVKREDQSRGGVVLNVGPTFKDGGERKAGRVTAAQNRQD